MGLPTVALNEDSPAGSAYIRGGDDRIREYKLQVREILEIDHFFPSSGQSDACGQHKRITLLEATDIGAIPATWVGTESTVFLGAQTEAGKPELCYRDEDDTDVILTDVGKIALQNGRLPNQTYLIARNQAGAANVNIFKVNASDIIEFATFPITPSAAPDADYEVANKKYIDDKFPVNLASGVTGTLPAANGGTGKTVMNVGRVAYTGNNQVVSLGVAHSDTTYIVLVQVEGSVTSGEMEIIVSSKATGSFTLSHNSSWTITYYDYITLGS
jgi:hypothetical protein